MRRWQDLLLHDIEAPTDRLGRCWRMQLSLKMMGLFP